MDEQVYSPGYRLEPLHWDGTTAGGEKLGNGLYVYTVTLSTGEGEVASDSGKLIISR